MSPAAREVGRTSGAVQARADRRLRITLVGVAAGILMALGMIGVVPLLTALDGGTVGFARIIAVALGGTVAIGTALFGPSGEPPGARLATRVGVVVAVSSIIVLAVALVVGILVAIDRVALLALLTGGLGLAFTIAVFASLLVGWPPGRMPSAGLPLRLLVGGATGTVTLATWAFAIAHLLGNLEASARQSAIEEARDVVALLVALGPDGSDKSAAMLVPPGGFIARLSPSGDLIPGSTVGIGTNDSIAVLDGACIIGHGTRTLPCAQQRLADGTRALVAMSAPRLQRGVVLLFAGVGVAAALIAFVLGWALGRGPADDLARVATVLDQLGRIDGGLDKPIVAVSLDEVGDLAVALDRLRVQLRPSLLEHDGALARARAANDERDQLLTLVSAELRDPLDRILVSATTLLDAHEAPLTTAQREDIRLIVSSATHLTSLIEEVLDLSAIATGQVRLHVSDFDLGALLNEVSRAQRPLIGSREVVMRVELPGKSVRVVADERRLRQVVTNLVSNAVKFTSQGAITLTASQEDERITLVVRDTGSGMDPAQLPRLFSEFVQLGNLRERARGTGLGLAICKRIIEAHGGTITAESELGKGTAFTVQLPAKVTL